MNFESLFDGILALSLLWIAWQTLTIRDLFRAVILFIVYGLLMALTWIRFSAPDVAIAYLAIGVGFTGVLLLDILRDIRESL